MEALNSKKPPPGSPSPAERIIPITILTGSHSATKPPPSSSGSASKSSNKEGKGDGGQVDSRRQSLIVTFDDGTEIETQGVVTSLGTTPSNGTNGQQGGSDSSRVKRNSRNCDALKIEEIGKETLRREIRNRSRSSSREKADRNKPETPTKVRIVPIRLSDGKVLTRDPDETMEIRTEFTNYTHTEYPDGSSAASPIPIPKEEKRRRRRSTSQTKTTTTETVTKTTERIVPITLANGDNFMPKFTTLDDLEPPEWSAFSPKNRAQNADQKETVVPIRMEQQQQQQQQQSRRYDHQRDSLLLDRKLNSGDARKRHSSGYSSSSVPNTTNVASSPPTSSILSNKREEFISTTIPPSTFSPTAVPDVTKSNNIPTSSATNSSSTSSSSDNNPRSSSSRESTPIRSSRKTSLTKSTTKTKETSRRETSSEKKHTVRFDMTADIADTPSRRRRQQFAQQVRSSSLDSSRSGVDGYQRQASPSPAVKARQRHPSSPATEKALNEIDADIHKIWLDLQELDRLPKDNKQHQPRSSTLPPKTSYASLSSPLVRPPPSHPPLVKPHPSTTVTPQRGATATPSPIATPVKVRTYNTPKPRVASANTHSIVLSTKPPHPPAYSSQHPSSVNHINPASLSSSNSSSSSSNSASLPVGSPTYNPRRDLEPTKPGSIQPLGGVRRIVTTAAPGGSGGAHAAAAPLATSVTVTSVQTSPPPVPSHSNLPRPPPVATILTPPSHQNLEPHPQSPLPPTPPVGSALKTVNVREVRPFGNATATATTSTATSTDSNGNRNSNGYEGKKEFYPRYEQKPREESLQRDEVGKAGEGEEQDGERKRNLGQQQQQTTTTTTNGSVGNNNNSNGFTAVRQRSDTAEMATQTEETETTSAKKSEKGKCSVQ